MHFDADSSKPNLRSREMVFRKYEPSATHSLYTPSDRYSGESSFQGIPYKSTKKRMVITWSPSHIETGLLSELLAYANIINGFKKNVKEQLSSKLEIIAIRNRKIMDGFEEVTDDLEKEGFLNKRFMLVGSEPNYKNENDGNVVFCFELCPEYLDYLRKVLKEYM